MDERFHLRNAEGQYLCYNEGFYYEWVDSAVLESRQRVGLVSFVGRDYALLKIREASTPKWEGNMVRPDYPDMTGAWAAPAL
jgi:hypothetical protein